MAKTDFKTIDDYIATFSGDARGALEVVRQTITDAVPGAVEVISYQIPAFKLGSGWIFYFSAYAKHYSLSCPPPFTVFEEFAEELASYKRSKSAIQFPYGEVPVDLISRMAKHRAQEIEQAARKS